MVERSRKIFGCTKQNWFDKNVKWKIGSRTRIRFWEDKWIEGMTLRQSYPKLCDNSKMKQSTLEEA